MPTETLPATTLDEAQRTEACPAPAPDEVEQVLNQLAKNPGIPAFARTRNVKEQFQHAFELIGGIPRLAMWAHENPSQFYSLYSKMIPQSLSAKHDGTLRVQLSWLDGRDTTGRSKGQIIDVAPIK